MSDKRKISITVELTAREVWQALYGQMPRSLHAQLRALPCTDCNGWGCRTCNGEGWAKEAGSEKG